MQRMLRSEDIGVAGKINRFRGYLKIEDDVAVFQIEYLESSGAAINFHRVLGSMRRLAVRHDVSQIRVEAAIANMKLLMMLSRKLGAPTPGSDSTFMDTWTFDV